MNDWIREILARYGQTVAIQKEDGEAAAQAFLQPMTERRERVPDDMCGIGALDGRLWLYLGQEKVDSGNTVQWNGQTFRVRSSRAYHIGDTPLYWWAVLEQEREAAE